MADKATQHSVHFPLRRTSMPNDMAANVSRPCAKMPPGRTGRSKMP